MLCYSIREGKAVCGFSRSGSARPLMTLSEAQFSFFMHKLRTFLLDTSDKGAQRCPSRILPPSATPCHHHIMSDDVLIKTFFAVHYMTAGMFVWEWLVSISFEFEYYLRHRRWTPAFVVYLIARYAAVLNLLLDQVAFHYTSPDIDCRMLKYWIGIAGAFAITASTLIFVGRACAIWAWKRIVSIPLLCLTLATLAGCLANLQWLHTEHVPQVGCVVTKVDIGFSVSNGMAITADVITLLALILGIYTQQDGNVRRNGIVFILLCDGILYVGTLLLFNIGSIIMSSTSTRPMSQLMLAAPTAFLRYVSRTSVRRCRADRILTSSVILSGRCHRSLVIDGSAAINSQRSKANASILSFASPVLPDHLVITREEVKVIP